MKKENLHEAEECYIKALEHDTNNCNIFFKLGLMLEESGRIDELKGIYLKSVKKRG